MTFDHETGDCTDPCCNRHQLVISRDPDGPTADDVLLAARVKGCVCDPDIVMPAVHEPEAELMAA